MGFVIIGWQRICSSHDLGHWSICADRTRRARNALLNMYQVESKQDVLASSKRELEEEKELLQRGKREAAAETDTLEKRREVLRDGITCVPSFGRKRVERFA